MFNTQPGTDDLDVTVRQAMALLLLSCFNGGNARSAHRSCEKLAAGLP